MAKPPKRSGCQGWKAPLCYDPWPYLSLRAPLVTLKGHQKENHLSVWGGPLRHAQMARLKMVSLQLNPAWPESWASPFSLPVRVRVLPAVSQQISLESKETKHCFWPPPCFCAHPSSEGCSCFFLRNMRRGIAVWESQCAGE